MNSGWMRRLALARVWMIGAALVAAAVVWLMQR
jgi:hypothetical protein